MGEAPSVAALNVVAPVSPITETPTQVVPPTTGVSAVPEPASWVLLTVGARTEVPHCAAVAAQAL